MTRLRLKSIHPSGLALGLVAPLVLFALLQIPDYTTDTLAAVDPPMPSARCPVATVMVPGSCAAQRLPAEESSPFYECDPGGTADARWRVTVRFDGLGPQRECGYEPRVVDSRQIKRALSSAGPLRNDTYPRWSARRDGDAWEVDIELAPWRGSAVVLTRTDASSPAGRVFAAIPIRVRAIRRDGISVRRSASVTFAAQCALLVAAMALMLRFRPGRRALMPDASPTRPRWVSVAAASAVGGGLMAVHAALRPADFGGFDFTQPWRIVMELPLGMLAAGFAGVWIDFCRRTYQDNVGVARGVAVLLAILVIALLAPRVYLATSAWSLPGWSLGYGYKTRYYTYFALAAVLPLVTVRVSRARPRAAARPAPASSLTHALVLFGVAFAACVVATVLAITAAESLHTELIAGRQMGFYKPLSGLGLLAIAAPGILGLAIGVSVPERRPPWLARLEAASTATVDEPDAAARARRCLALLAALCRRQDADPGDLANPEAATLSHHVGWLVPSFCRTDADRDQLAAAVAQPRARVDALLVAALDDLEVARSLAPPPPSAEILLTHPGFSHVRVTVLAEVGLSPGETPVMLMAHGALLDGPPLQRVTATVDQVLAFLGPHAAAAPAATYGRRVFVELTSAPTPGWDPSLEGVQLGVAAATFCALRGLPSGFEAPAVFVEPESGALSAPASLGGTSACDLPGFLSLIET